MCDDFFEGAYLPTDNKIMLCANTLMLKTDFDNAIRRQLIFMYDNIRGKGSYNMEKCKHLACTEIRASLFSDKCKLSQNALEMFRKSNQGPKIDAQKYCFKNQAIEHLKEKFKCRDKADQYVNYVFDQCLNDKSPFVASGKGDGKFINASIF